LGERYHGGPNPIPAAVTAAVGTGLVLWWLRPFRFVVDGPSMAPTLLPGDFVVGTGAGRVRPGAVVVVEHPRRPGYEMVKRVAVMPREGTAGGRLGADEHWLLGDDPSFSTDSRAFGAVPRSAIVGVVRLRYWPLRRVGLVR
jgi:nickel-type superoxide dismutase maturation protease